MYEFASFKYLLKTLILYNIFLKADNWKHQFIQELKDKAEWKPTTVKSLINRLLNKNAIGFNKSGNEYLYFALLSEDKCIKSESESFINRGIKKYTNPTK